MEIYMYILEFNNPLGASLLLVLIEMRTNTIYNLTLCDLGYIVFVIILMMDTDKKYIDRRCH